MTLDPDDPLKDQDEDLVRAARDAREGDLQAFEQLVDRHRKRILADCRYLTRDENNSEDLAQEVFVKAFFGLRNFEGRSSFRHWLQRIKVNHCLNHLKKRESGDVLIDEDAAEAYEQLRCSRRCSTESGGHGQPSAHRRNFGDDACDAPRSAGHVRYGRTIVRRNCYVSRDWAIGRQDENQTSP